MKTSISVLAGLCLISMLGTSARAQTTGQPYALNAIIPLTGGGAFLGKAYTEAFRAVENVVNRTGGIGDIRSSSS